MKAGDTRRVSTLRLVNSALKNADIEARGQGKRPLSDEDLLSLLQKMIKQRHESVELYEKGGRPELAAQEGEEMKIISGYVPRQMTDQEIHDTIGALVKEVGASAMKDMGKVMAAIKERYAGKLDVAKASAAVKKTRGGVFFSFPPPRLGGERVPSEVVRPRRVRAFRKLLAAPVPEWR